MSNPHELTAHQLYHACGVAYGHGSVQQRLRELRQRYAHPQQDGPAGNGQTEK